MKHPLITKLAALGAVFVLLLIGLAQIEDVVRDRQRYRTLTAQSVADSLAGPQTLMGPMIHSACVESWDAETGKGEERRTTEQRREFLLTAMPEQLQVRSSVGMEERARGLHKVNTFNLKTHLTAQWAGLEGQGLLAVLPEGVRGQAEPLTLALDLELVGTERLSIVPLGGNTDVKMTGSWPHPSFNGRFLPSERTWGPEGFTAQWRLSSLATTAQQDVQAGRRICAGSYDDAPTEYAPAGTTPRDCADSFGVAFVDPVNPYTLADRATKYGLLFIALTFVAVGLFELMGNGPHAPPLRGSLPPEGAAFSSWGGPATKRLRVHPVQYLLVGAALCSFFLLLVSLSEHLPFGWSYLAAATACVLLLGYYASHMLGGLARGLPLGLGIALLYGLLYVLLQLEQTALAVGSVALFLVLTAVMVLTRKVNWYGLTPAQRSTPPAMPAAAPKEAP